MKKLILAIMVLIPMGLAAQNKSFDDLLSKYEGTDGFVCMNMAGDMLQSTLGAKSTEAAETMKDISSMKLIVAERSNDAFRSDLKEFIGEDKYESLFSVVADGTNVQFYILKGDAGKSADEEKEMLLVVNTPEGQDVAINMIGKGDPAKMMEHVNIN